MILLIGEKTGAELFIIIFHSQGQKLELNLGYQSLWSVDLKKKYACQKALLVVNWVQIYNQSLAVIVYQGFSHIYFSESHRPSCQATRIVLLLAKLTLTKEFLELYFDQ